MHFLFRYFALALVRNTGSEEAVVLKVLERFGFSYPVTITTVLDGPLQGFPWIRPTDLLEAMGRMNDLSLLLAGKSSFEDARQMLLTFWEKYRAIAPKHELWRRVEEGRPLHKCLPLLVHGDEGVTYKRNGVLVLSLQPVVGYGTSKMPKEMLENYRAFREKLPMNYLGTGMETRFLSVICPKDFKLKTKKKNTHAHKENWARTWMTFL